MKINNYIIIIKKDNLNMNKKSNKHKQKIKSKNRTNKNLIHNSPLNINYYDLNKLINDKDFIEAFISYIFTK